MGEQTHISWCDATLNFWIGCTKVSTGAHGACQFCYAETWAMRWPTYQDTWGVGATRIRTAGWISKVRKLEKLALAKRAAGEGAFFCFSNSLSDIFDNEVPIEWLTEAFAAIRLAPHVTFLLLTKRPQNIVKRFKAAMEPSLGPYADEMGIRSQWPRNAAILCTVVTQAEADRDLWALMRAKAALRPAFAGVSMEPLMEEVNIRPWLRDLCPNCMRAHCVPTLRADGAEVFSMCGEFVMETPGPGLDWVITGGESGTHARPSRPDWFRSLAGQCAEAAVPFHFKQWGEWVSVSEVEGPQTAFYQFEDGATVRRVGKVRAGRLLDGIMHDARPDID